MIRHVVLMKFENPEDSKTAAELLKSLEGCSGLLKKLDVGLDFVHAATSYDLLFETQFETRDDQLEFQNDPAHVKVRRELKKLPKTSVKVDYVL